MQFEGKREKLKLSILTDQRHLQVGEDLVMKGEAIDVLEGSPPVSYSNNRRRKISNLEIFSDPDRRHQRAGLSDSDSDQPGGRSEWW